MRIERFSPASDRGAVNGCYDLYTAAHRADDPDGPPLITVDPSRRRQGAGTALLRHLTQSARKHGRVDGYDALLHWTGPAPQEYLGQVAAVSSALSDAPHDDADGELHLASGELADLTQAYVAPDDPAWGNADSNKPVNAINQALGFTVIDRWADFTLDLMTTPATRGGRG